jgi:hypothetical protein
MTKIIKIIDVKNKNLKSRAQHYEALISLIHMLGNSETSAHEKLICDFIESWKPNEKKPEKSLSLFTFLITSDISLQSIVGPILGTLPVEAQSTIIHILQKTWPEDNDIILRLKHISQLVVSWKEQCPNLSFSEVIPPLEVYEFLKNFEKGQ